jgi:SAM-dependent methyltransferase
MDQERLTKEREFFDHEEYSEGPIPANTIERYTQCRKPFLPVEYLFWILGDVRGKRALELGCGDGSNAVLLALKGADVVGIDISPRAIEIARRRAVIHGVADHVEFRAEPLESYLEGAHGQFDVIYGFAVLHHLLPVLDQVMASLKRLSRDGTCFVFSEPVSLAKWLRRLRLALPVKCHSTPDERPLEPEDLAILRHHLPDMQVRVSGFLTRIWNRAFHGRYEDHSASWQWLYDTLSRFDTALLSLPGFNRLASSAAIHSGSPRTAAGRRTARQPQ